MGWGVNDYPSPREPKIARCSARGCDIAHDEESYECAAKACKHRQLCIGCVYACPDCGEDFCEQHTVFGEDAATCAACASKRNEIRTELEREAA